MVTSERLLVCSGGDRIVPPSASVRIDVRHVTAAIRDGLCRFDQSEASPQQIAAEINCASSILLSEPGAPILEQTGVTSSETRRKRVQWSGDRNFYEGFTAFWTIENVNPEYPPEVFGFEDWRNHWCAARENFPTINRVQWRQLPGVDRPVHQQTPEDYVLSTAESPPNAALGAASDGQDAGFVAARLPAVPSVSLPVPSTAGCSSRRAQRTVAKWCGAGGFFHGVDRGAGWGCP